MAKELVDLELQVKKDHEANKAIAVFNYNDKGKTVWLPRSLIEIEYKDQHRRTATITMPEWLAQEKGLI